MYLVFTSRGILEDILKNPIDDKQNYRTFACVRVGDHIHTCMTPMHDDEVAGMDGVETIIIARNGDILDAVCITNDMLCNGHYYIEVYEQLGMVSLTHDGIHHYIDFRLAECPHCGAEYY